MRQVGGDRDDRLRSAPDGAQRLGDVMRIGVADEDGNDLERGRQHRLQHHEMHFERVLAGERPRDRRRRPAPWRARHARSRATCASPSGVRHFAAGWTAIPRKATRCAGPMMTIRRGGSARLRPRAEGGRRDRAGIDEAGMRRDHDLRRDAAVRRAPACADPRSERSAPPAPPDRTSPPPARDGFRLSRMVTPASQSPRTKSRRGQAPGARAPHCNFRPTSRHDGGQEEPALSGEGPMGAWTTIA